MTVDLFITRCLHCLIVLGAVCVGADCSIAYAQNADKRPLGVVFAEALSGYKQPGGVVVVENSCGEPSVFAAPLPSGSYLNASLDSIARANPGYRLVRGEATNFIPLNALPPFLNARVNNYSVDSDKDAEASFAELLELPELTRSVDEAGLKKWPMQIAIGASRPLPKAAGARHVKYMSGVSVLEVLNQVAVQQRIVWAYVEYTCDGKPRGSLRIAGTDL